VFNINKHVNILILTKLVKAAEVCKADLIALIEPYTKHITLEFNCTLLHSYGELYTKHVFVIPLRFFRKPMMWP